MNIILFISRIDGIDIGGAEIFTLRLAKQFAKRGHTVTLLTTQPIRQWLKDKRVIKFVEGIRIIRLPVWWKGKFRIFPRMMLAEIFLTLQLDLRRTQILHIRKLDAEAVTLGWMANAKGIKTVCIPMASGPYGDVAKFPSRKRRDPGAFNWISALTDHVRQEVIEWGFPPERIGVIPNGVDTDFFAPSANPPPITNVVYIGRFRPEKRCELLLQAWQQVQSSHPKAHLTLVGGAGLTPRYEQIAANLKIEPAFVPTASAEEVRDYLQRNSIFVLPGVSEGMSNALLEAMSVGLAPVVSNVGGNLTLVSPEVNGLCYDKDSPDELAAQLRRLLDDVSLRERLGSAARQTILHQYSLDSIVDQYLALYKRIINEA